MSGIETIMMAAMIGGSVMSAGAQLAAGEQAEWAAKQEQMRLEHEAEQL